MRRARRDYYLRGYYVRRRQRAALALRLALSSVSGALNQPAGGTPSGIGVPSDNQVFLIDPIIDIARGDTLTYTRVVKLWDVDRSYVTGTINPYISLTAQ